MFFVGIQGLLRSCRNGFQLRRYASIVGQGLCAPPSFLSEPGFAGLVDLQDWEFDNPGNPDSECKNGTRRVPATLQWTFCGWQCSYRRVGCRNRCRWRPVHHRRSCHPSALDECRRFGVPILGRGLTCHRMCKLIY